jgi:AcrR family transcriptional regulator
MPQQSRLSRARWIEAALDALADGGVSAVAVEPLAARLGVTKGSFYWHFRDRDELLAAALEEWERTGTEALIERLGAIGDPRERLAAWARSVLAADKAQLAALHAAADHPIVRPVLRRNTERRIRYLTDLLREAGVRTSAARRRLLYSADLTSTRSRVRSGPRCPPSASCGRSSASSRRPSCAERRPEQHQPPSGRCQRAGAMSSSVSSGPHEPRS